MGARQSSQSASSLAVADGGPSKEELLADFDLSAPSAAVIGGGMSGVHCALELAKMGFKVTVFDRRSKESPLGGSTTFSRPIVGVGSRYLPLADVRVSADLVRGFLPLGVPDVYSADQAHISFFSSVIHRWLYARFTSTNGKGTLLDRSVAGDELVRRSTDIVHELITEYRDELGPFARPLNSVRMVTSQGETDARSLPVHPKPLLIDPVGWTNALRSLCTRQYGVSFRYNTYVTSLSPSFRHSTEFIRGVYYTDGTVDRTTGKQVIQTDHFDVYVVATGASCGPLTDLFAPMPVAGMRGFGVEIPTTHPAVTIMNDHSKSITVSGTPDNNSAYSYTEIVPSCGVSMFTPLNNPSCQVLSGLMSFDTYSSTLMSPNRIWDRFAAALRVKKGIELPSLLGSGGDAGKSPRVFQYNRCFSPDGLPIVARAGNMFNCFVVTGLGDDTCQYAPASAKHVAALVDPKRLHEDNRNESTTNEDHSLESMLSLSRFPGYYRSDESLRAPQKKSTLEKTSDMETNIMNGMLPLKRQLNHFMTDLARLDNAPDTFRNFVFQNFYDEDDEVALRKWVEIEERTFTKSSFPSGRVSAPVPTSHTNEERK